MDASFCASPRLQDCQLREACLGDALAVARVHVDTWRAAYTGIVPDTVLAGLCVDSHAGKWSTAIEKREPELWVAETQGAIVGWAAFSASRDADAPAACGELQAIYVARSWWACGLGSALLAHSCWRLKQRGFERMTLWVLQANEGAIHFYQACGLAPDGGSKQFELANKSLTEVRYATTLQDVACAERGRARIQP
jgi:GNAT superfamily N-acetyltransferase